MRAKRIGDEEKKQTILLYFSGKDAAAIIPDQFFLLYFFYTIQSQTYALHVHGVIRTIHIRMCVCYSPHYISKGKKIFHYHYYGVE